MPGEQSTMDENSYPGQRTPDRQAEFQRRLDEDRAQWLATLKAQQTAAEFAGELAATQGDIMDKIAATLDRINSDPNAEDIRVDAAYQRGVEAGRAQAPPLDYPKHWGSGAIEREHAHRERMARWSAEKEFQRGVAIGRAEREAELLDAQVLHAEAGPSDYDRWRGALLISAVHLQGQSTMRELQEVAEYFHERLAAGPPPPPDPDCRHCGADSSMDHTESCPNGQSVAEGGGTLQTGQDDDGVPYARVVPTEQSGHAEIDCVRCGAPPGGHADGCPTMFDPREAEEIRRQNVDLPQAESDALNNQAETTYLEAEGERKAQEAFEQGFGTYPGHDMTVTTGGCGPEHPCPACRQRIAQSDPS